MLIYNRNYRSTDKVIVTCDARYSKNCKGTYRIVYTAHLSQMKSYGYNVCFSCGNVVNGHFGVHKPSWKPMVEWFAKNKERLVESLKGTEKINV